eukprot:4900484-Amphidinium_carterae.1
MASFRAVYDDWCGACARAARPMEWICVTASTGPCCHMFARAVSYQLQARGEGCIYHFDKITSVW